MALGMEPPVKGAGEITPGGEEWPSPAPSLERSQALLQARDKALSATHRPLPTSHDFEENAVISGVETPLVTPSLLALGSGAQETSHVASSLPTSSLSTSSLLDGERGPAEASPATRPLDAMGDSPSGKGQGLLTRTGLPLREGERHTRGQRGGKGGAEEGGRRNGRRGQRRDEGGERNDRGGGRSDRGGERGDKGGKRRDEREEVRGKRSGEGGGSRRARSNGGGRWRRALGELSELPPSLISDTQGSAFTAPSLGIWEDAPACQGVRPGPHMSPSRLILGRNWTAKEIVRGAKGDLPMRAVIWSARSGMGNSFQGLVATFIYALLSGRQIVASLGGLYGATFETVGRGFHFGLDWTQPQVPRVPLINFDREFAIVEAAPVVQANPRDFHDSFWVGKEALSRCVMQAMSCRDVWCVRSKIVNIVLGTPKEALGRAIRKTLNFQPCTFLGGSTGAADEALPGEEGGPGSGARRRRLLDSTAPVQAAAGTESNPRGRSLGQREEDGQEARDGQDALKMKFDVAIHVRTVSTCSEGYTAEPACKDRGLAGVLGTLEFLPRLHHSLMHQRWACISSLLAFLLQLKLTKLQGRSKGAMRGGATGASVAGAPPLGGLFFDPGDGDRVREFVNASLLRRAELALTEQQLASTAGLFAPTPLPRNLTARLAHKNLWRVEHSQFLSLKARQVAAAQAAGDGAESGAGGAGGGDGGGGEGGLSILLATDSEALRPLLVEYLRPFGTVTFSAAHIMHLGLKGAGDDTERLGNLAEFYLMSRAAVILSYKRSRSSYARTAGFYGNATLLYGMEQKTCDFPLEHVAEVMGGM